MKRQEEAEAKKEEGGGGWWGWAAGWGTSSTEKEKEDVAVTMPTGLYRANAPCTHVGTSSNHCKEMSEKLKSPCYDFVLRESFSTIAVLQLSF